MSPLELVDDRFEKLAAELRAARPVAPARLRERVLALPAPEPRRAWPSFRWAAPRVAIGGVAVSLAVAAAIAVVNGGSSSPSRPLAVKERVTTTRGQAQALAPKARKALPLQFEQGAPAATAGRLQQYDATLRLRVKDVDALSNATKNAMSITRGLGGYVASVGYSTRDGSRGGATLVLRVPTAQVETALQRFSSFGTILGQHASIVDVQRRSDRQTRQISERVKDLARIEALLAGSPTPARRAQLEAQARADRAALTRLQRTQARLVNRARFARVSLALTTPADRPAAAPSRFHRTLDDAGSVLARELEVLLYALVVVGPLLLLGGIAIAFGRAQRRRSDGRLLDRV